MARWNAFVTAARGAAPEGCLFRAGGAQCVLPPGHDGLHEPGAEPWQLANRMREESIAVLERRVAALEGERAEIRGVVDRYAELVERYAGAMVTLVKRLDEIRGEPRP